jgi:hypothetical protein
MTVHTKNEELSETARVARGPGLWYCCMLSEELPGLLQHFSLLNERRGLRTSKWADEAAR